MEESGLTSKEALLKLCKDIESTLNQFIQSQSARKAHICTYESLHHLSQHTCFCWISIFCSAWITISLFVAYSYEGRPSILCQAVFIFILTILNSCMESDNIRARCDEIPKKIRALVEKIKADADGIKWSPGYFPNIQSPYSPCITLQWTYRDGHLVNLPWPLLVKGDIVLLKPGQVSPGYCQALDDRNSLPFLNSKQIFAPSEKHEPEVLKAPKIRKPLECKKYRLLETPYLNNLTMYLEQALDRPVSFYLQQRHFLVRKVIELSFIPFMIVVSYGVSIVRCLYWDIHSEDSRKAVWILTWPVCVVLPLVPFMLPIVWNTLNIYGIASLQTLFDAMRNGEHDQDDTEDDDLNVEFSNYSKLGYNHKEIIRNFHRVLRVETDIVFRTTNIVHVLGSVTALGCVDKKGILSWPNPAADKVFFLHNNERSEDLVFDSNENISMNSPRYFRPESPSDVVADILDLTHNHDDPFKLHFDDPNWNRHLTSLKPLGLAILLNTCNVSTQEHYAAFCSHISCEALCNENLVPVTNRRCLCELAKEIGFKDDAQNVFALGQQLCTYKHLQTERKDRLSRSWSLPTKLKFPFPHMFSVVIKELNSGCAQLFSEGTADIVLDACVDYWDGYDLRQLTNLDRKNIRDFYERCSLTAYCTAFAYRPLTSYPNNDVSCIYLELPFNYQLINLNQSSPAFVQWNCRPVLDPETRTFKGPSVSKDSLPHNEYQPIDPEACTQIQSNQVFIGMVEMQYQALHDMVKLIEQLERACIRFVHFSKENELRSRVFSEKMGLESGWNCHISLMSDRDGNKENSRRLSSSAPPALSFSQPLLRFDAPVEKVNKDYSLICESAQDKLADERLQIHLDSNNAAHDWQSLSCLTDSTEHSAPINFDMSNRAKLPRGIAEIRPHIEEIDNVPLLVSLFTDCTPHTTKEMLNIMQDYREIVCVMGSSANCENAGIFMQADASIGVEPFYPQMCQKSRVFERKNGLSPNDIAARLNAIPCSLAFNRDDPVSIHRLIMESRHFMKLVWNCVQFWICCCASISILQITVLILLLPPLLSIGQVLWFCLLIIPLLSFSLVGTPVDTDIMKKPQGKNQNVFNIDIVIFVCWCYGTRFIAAVLTVLVAYVGILFDHCRDFCALHNCTCLMYHTPFFETPNTAELYNSVSIVDFARVVAMVILFLDFIVLSMGFIHREHLMFQRGPYRNILWIGIIFVLCLLHTLYVTICSIGFNIGGDRGLDIPPWVFIFTFLSPLLVAFISEITKCQEIKVNKRFQKRARLDFGTKLGMNSPF